jgi:hypothetical protein
VTQQPGYDGLNINSPMLTKARGGSIRDAYRRAFNDDRARMGIPLMGGGLDSPELSPTMTYGTGVGGDKSISVSGTVTGEGKMEVTVNAGSSLLDVVKQAEAAIKLSGNVNSNGAGSLGHSSPDAAAPAPASAPQAPISY